MRRPSLSSEASQVNPETQAVVLNGIPLVALTLMCAGVSGALGRSLLERPSRLREPEVVPALIYPCLAILSGIAAVAVFVRQEPLAGHVWVGAAAIALAMVPPALLLLRWRRRGAPFREASRALAAEERTERLRQHRDAVNAFTRSLVRARSEWEIAQQLVRAVAEILGVPFVAFGRVEAAWIQGVYAEQDGQEAEWWSAIRLDRSNETSAMVSAAFEASPLTIYDVDSSPLANRRLAERVGARSAAFIPCQTGRDVLGVFSAVTYEHHAFSREELDLLEELATETALALERSEAAATLAAATQREHVTSEIAAAFGTEGELPVALQTAAAALARAVPGTSRVLVRLGNVDHAKTIDAEWRGEGFEPVGAERTLPDLDLAAAGRRTVAIDDVEAASDLDEGGRHALLGLGSRAVLATPIVFGDRTVGAMALHRPDPGSWTGHEVALVEAAAKEAGAAIYTAELRDDRRTRVRAQEALLQAAQALADELRSDNVLERLAREVVGHVGGDGAECRLLDARRATLTRRAAYGLVPPGETEVRLEGPLAEAVAQGRPLLRRGTAAAPFAEVMIAPISFLGEGRGILRVWAAEEPRFSDAHLALLAAFATVASLALRNAEAHDETTRQERVQRGFYRIAALLAEPLSLESTQHALAQAAGEALGASFAAVLMPGPLGRLRLTGAEGLPEELAQTLATGLPAGEGALHAAAAEGRLLAAPDLAHDSRFGDEWRELAGRAGCRSLLAIPVPLPFEGEGWGLALVFFVEQRTFTDDDLELAQHVAGAARGALERGAAFEEERTARSLAQRLARTGGRLATELDPTAVLDEVVEQAPDLVGVDACAIHVLEGDDLVVTAAAGADTAQVLGARTPAAGWVSGDVVQGGTPLAVEDAAGDDRLLFADPLLRLGYRAYLGVPLSATEGAAHGVLAVYSREPKSWRDAEVEALLALAGNASAALSNAELYQRVAIEKERSEAILANVADGIVAVDREGLVVLWNAAAERITGVPVADAVGRAPVEVLGRDLRADGDEDEQRRNRQVSILRAGEEVWLSVSEAVMRDPGGAVAGRIYAFRDISTERVVEEMKSEFVSTVSEQLRRPLTSIYGFAETLLREDVRFAEPERRTFLRYIASESERLTGIVDQLLNVARLDSGDLQVQLAPTDVASVVDEVVGAIEASAPEGVLFTVDLPTSPVAVMADRDKLRIVLGNLLDNAVKFSPSGGRVTVSARQREEVVEITVADEGIGIPPAAQERVFRKFARGDGSAEVGSPGTGVGLFIVQGLVGRMNGRVWVTSAEGEGSRFTFELPASQDEPAAMASRSDAERV
jgi:PAS domain S-box-containing protein